MIFSFASSLFPDKFDSTIDMVTDHIPDKFQDSPILLISAILLALIGASIVFRFIKGRDNLFNQVISCAFHIGMIYCSAVILYHFAPTEWKNFWNNLPFTAFRNDRVFVDPFYDTPAPNTCLNILYFTLLCMLSRVSDSLLGHFKKVYFWLPFKLLSIILTILAYSFITILIDVLFPGVAMQYASIILLIVLSISLLVGLFNPLLCIVFTVVNPVFGLLYTFFFSSFFGKLISGSVLCTACISLFLLLFERLGYSEWNITNSYISWWCVSGFLLLSISYFLDTKIRK